MRVSVADVRRAGNGHVLLTLAIFAAAGERSERYRLPLAVYEAAGSPCEGERLDADTYLLLTAEEGEKKAYERAVKILAAGDNSRRMLCRKLTERGFLPAYAEAAVARLSEEGYLKEEEMLDRQFALFAPRFWGPGKYMPSLLQKGFDRAAIAAAEERAGLTGVYDREAVKAALLEKFRPQGNAERTALLYRFGFR